MQRTYGRRASRRRSSAQPQNRDEHEPDELNLSGPSPPRKRHKVFVEIVSPKRQKSWSSIHAQNQSPLLPDTRHQDISDSRPSVPTHLGPTPGPSASGSPKTPERSHTDSFMTPSHSRSGSQSKRGSIIKRMLGRSRTESSIDGTPLANASFVASSIARQSSSHSLPTTFPERETTPEAASQPSPKPLPSRHVRTYAGSSRSFLVALAVPDAPLSTVEDETEPHESYADLRTRWGIDMSEDDPQPYQDEPDAAPTPLRRTASELSQPSLPTGMMNDLKSITELRSQGESRRFLDEVGYLFEGLDGSSAIGLRRASAFEIASKLCDIDFNRRAKTSDFYVRTWDKLWTARAGTTDKVFDATIAFFAALAARDPIVLVEVAQQEIFIPTLVEILGLFDHRKDVLASVLAGDSDDDLKSQNILRTEYTALKSLATLVANESFLVQPSGRFFVSHSLATLPPSLLADQYLPTLLVNFRAELSLLEPRIIAYESGIPLFPPTRANSSATPSLYHIEACLRLLDSYLLGHWSSAGGSSSGLSHMSGFTSELLSLCIASSGLLEESEEEAVLARRCLCGAMRVLTLLSHDDSWWCGAALEVSHALPFATMMVMRSQAKWLQSRQTDSQNSSVEAFDLLCLALGLVMNWATLSPKVRALSRIKSINPTCPGSRLCARACRCLGQKSVLECFTLLHIQYFDHCQGDPPECVFLRGYTAILLGLLMKDDASNQAIVMSTLPGTSRSSRMKSLISHCRSFLDLYNDTIPLPSSDSPRASPEVASTSNETSGHHRATWDKKGEEIARSVIASLELLCDT